MVDLLGHKGLSTSAFRYVVMTPLGVFTLVTRGWAASEFLTRASKFNMTPNGAF